MYLTRIVLAEHGRELDSARAVLDQESPLAKQVALLEKHALSPRHVALLPEKSIFLRPVISFDPFALEPSNSRQTTNTFASFEVERKIASDEYLEYSSRATKAPELEWAQVVSAVFPTLAVAIHLACPETKTCCSITYRGGVRVREVDFSDIPLDFIEYHWYSGRWPRVSA